MAVGLMFTCPRCGAVSHNPNDAAHRYCGRCHVFVEDAVSRLPNNETGKYILNGHEPVEEADLFKWAEWMENADRQVADTFRDDVRVSTVFLGLDHGFCGDGPPVVFETMVFINGSGDEMQRYCTWDEAVEGHKRMVDQVFKPTPILTLPTSEKE